MTLTTGRTVTKHVRFYAGGYDLSGYSRSAGPLTWEYDTADLTAQMGDAVKGYLPAIPTIGIGTLNAVFDNTATTGMQALMSVPGVSRICMLPIGIHGDAAAGHPVFCGRFPQASYIMSPDGWASIVNIGFDSTDEANLTAYSNPWGWLIHAKGTETAANTGTGIDDYGGQSLLGGYMIYQIFSSAATTTTISIDDSANNSAFTPLSGATSGAINTASIPTAGIVALSATATVRQYLRWQIAFAGGSNSCSFALAFVRETRA